MLFSRRLFSQWMQLWHFKLVWMKVHGRFEGNLRLQVPGKVVAECGLRLHTSFMKLGSERMPHGPNKVHGSKSGYCLYHLECAIFKQWLFSFTYQPWHCLWFNINVPIVKIYCEIIIFRGGSIFMDFMEPSSNEITSPTNNDVFKRNWNYNNIVEVFRGMHVLPAKHSYAWLPRKCDYRTDRRRTKWTLCAAILRRWHKKKLQRLTCKLQMLSIKVSWHNINYEINCIVYPKYYQF